MARLSIILAVALTFAAAGMPFTAFGASLSVSAYILGKGSCSITSTTPVTFPNLNPTNPVPVTANGTVTVNCKGLGNQGGTFVVSLVTATPLTLKHISPVSSDTIPYSLALPTGGTITANGSGTATVNVTGSIAGATYTAAPAGQYQDIVTVQVNP